MSRKVKVSFLSVLSSHRGELSVIPNHDENDIEESCEVSDRRPAAAEPWRHIVVSTSLLNSLSFDCS